MTLPPGFPRLAIVLSHPVQYYSPWFRELHATGLTLRVFYLWDFGVVARPDPQFGTTVKWDIDLLAGYESEFVPNAARHPGTHHFRGLDNPPLPDRLAAWGPDAVLLFGYNWLSHQRALRWARRYNIPVLLRGDSHLLGRGRPGWLRRLALRFLFRKFAAALPVGRANRDYYRAFGIPDSRLFLAPHAVESSRFNPDDPATRQAAAALRGRLGLDGRRVVLFAGKFHERKQPLPLLRAFQAVAGPRDALVFVGDGPERPRLEAAAAERPDVTVRFLPFANQTEMPARYAAADIFVLPSRGHSETWGLAVNEAMHLGLPCLVSDLVGCQQDLVTPGETGWVFPADDHGALAASLRAALATAPDELVRLGRNARTRVARSTYREATEGLRRALAVVVPSPA